ncbi:leucine-rich repeats and immunoglobulin-like domains protein 1 isoform X2 [Varroa destructor]|uniref:Ig-like domain-containing protein n=1 Tax=Varroa destructor TaxID=109461 RepID=A0A7M7JI58_VARDE|nr:leucine-rich repeats and immunoglobulin-like domains protein 1 isoform X2 [Varroa destructor]
MTASVAWVVRWTQFVLFLSLSGVTRGQHMFCPALCTCLEEFVDCSRKGLTTVPQDLPSWTLRLNISYNQISEVHPEAWTHTPHLKVLRMSNNSLTEIPEGLSRLRELEELILNANEISLASLRSGFASNESDQPSGDSVTLVEHPLPHSLLALDLSLNRLGAIEPRWFGRLSRLQLLNLQNNRITLIERNSLDNLTSLRSLNLSRNRLTKLPKDLFRKTIQLKKIDLSRNQLQMIEGLTFQSLEHLEVLNLRKNRISVLSDGAFYGLSNIQQLHLEFNNIPVVSKAWLYGLHSLRQLFVQNNSIVQVVPDAFESCKKLQEVNLENNRIEAIQKGSFLHLASIQTIQLSSNRIGFIEDSSFKTLSSLQTLELNNNELQWAVEDTNAPFIGLSKLTRLGLANNSIQALPSRAFAGLSKVRSLNLDLNPLSAINQEAFRVLKRISELRLNTTALLCDCGLSWLPEWLRSVGVERHIVARCAFPLELKGRDVLSFGPSYNWSCGVFSKPEILESPQSPLLALKGRNVTLSCKATMNTTVGAELILFDWRKENRILRSSDASLLYTGTSSTSEISSPPASASGRSLETFANTDPATNRTVFTSRLQLFSVVDGDEGKYQCIARNRFGSSYSNRSRVSVHVFPTFTKKPPARMTAVAGDSVVLECAAIGQPKPVISWQKDGGDDFPAARERRMQLMPSDAIFYIEKLKTADQGVYTCTANNSAGPVRTNVTLTVNATPQFVRPMVSKDVHEGETAVIECLSEGNPASRRRWYKDGLPLQETQRYLLAKEGEVLLIMQAGPADGGRYACEISNDAGSQRQVSQLNIAPAPGQGATAFLWPAFFDKLNTLGIVVIAVVICVIITSLIWVVILLSTRKRLRVDKDDPEGPTGRNSRRYSGGVTQSVYGGSCSADEDDSVSMLGVMQPIHPVHTEPGIGHGVNARLLVDDTNRTIVNLASGRAYFMKEQSLNNDDDEGISSGGSSSTSHHATPAHGQVMNGTSVVHRVSTFQPEPPTGHGASRHSSSSLASVDVPPNGAGGGLADEAHYTTQGSPHPSPKPAVPRKPPHLTPQPSKKLQDQLLLRQRQQQQQQNNQDNQLLHRDSCGEALDAEDPELIEISHRCQKTLSQRSINGQLRKSTLTPSRLHLDVSSYMDSPDMVLGGSVTPTATIRRTPGPRSPSPSAVVPVPPPCIPGPFCYESGLQEARDAKGQGSLGGPKSRPATPKRTTASATVIEPSEEQRSLKPFSYGNPFEGKTPKLLRNRSVGGDEDGTNGLKQQQPATTQEQQPKTSTPMRSQTPKRSVDLLDRSTDDALKLNGGLVSPTGKSLNTLAAGDTASNQQQQQQQGPPKRAPPPPPPPPPPMSIPTPASRSPQQPQQPSQSSQFSSTSVIV